LPHSQTGQALELLSHIHLLWFSRDYFFEGKEWLNKLLSVHSDHTPARARAYILGSVFARIEGDSDKQLEYTQKALKMSLKFESKKLIAWSLCWMGIAECDRQNYSDAIDYLTESLEILQNLEENIWIVFAKYFLALSYMLNGDLEEAEKFWNQGIELCIREGLEWHIAQGMEGLGSVERLRGNFFLAKEFFSEELKIKLKYNDTAGVAYSIGNFAVLSAAQKEYKKAAKLWGAAEKFRHKLDHTGVTISFPDKLIERTCYTLGETEFNADWSAGQNLTRQEAIAYALSL
jgi:tetratricopeptide (TPR) repeat protein